MKEWLIAAMNKVRWILGQTTSRPSSPVYREAKNLLLSQEPEVGDCLLDDHDDGYDSYVGDVLMRPVLRRA